VLRLFFICLLFLPLAGHTATYPIKLVSGLLVSEATIEGKQVHVIFDSGAPGLVLNSKYYSADSPNSFDDCVGINGSFSCQSRLVKNWSWMDAKYKQTSALISDLSFLENGLHEEIHALVGLSVFSDYYVSLDFDNMTVTLSKKIDLDKQDIIRFQYVDQLPVITCQINGEKKILGLDTGSEINYLFSISPEKKSSMMHHATPVLIVGTENKQDLKYSTNMDVTLNGDDYYSSFIIDKDEVSEFHHPSFDGFLGLEFLDHFNIIIHPGKQIIQFTPRANAEEGTIVSALGVE
jgi:hypothetical protein